MKFVIPFLFLTTILYGQVGINTSTPMFTLDVNGKMRVSDMSAVSMDARKLMAVDINGVMIEIELDQNLYIEDNILKHNTRRESVFSLPDLNVASITSLTNIIWPGGTGDGRSTIRIVNLLGDLSVAGIDMSGFTLPLDAHGYTVIVYNVSGTLTFTNLDVAAPVADQFLLLDGLDTTMKQFEMVKIMYDGILQKWLIVSRNQ